VNCQLTNKERNAIIAILDDVGRVRVQLPISLSNATRLDQAVHDVESELQQSQPRHLFISENLRIIRELMRRDVLR